MPRAQPQSVNYCQPQANPAHMVDHGAHPAPALQLKGVASAMDFVTTTDKLWTQFVPPYTESEWDTSILHWLVKFHSVNNNYYDFVL